MIMDKFIVFVFIYLYCVFVVLYEKYYMVEVGI